MVFMMGVSPKDDVNKSLLQAGMSASTFHRILRLARTIADLEGAPDIKTLHLAEGIECRPRRHI